LMKKERVVTERDKRFGSSKFQDQARKPNEKITNRWATVG